MNELLKTSYKILVRENPSSNHIKLMVMYREKRIPEILSYARVVRIAYER
tara:strand:+ start:2435 stop:2584 length:150 start_codon:yes stop_codon:yes gene_type:complete